MIILAKLSLLRLRVSVLLQLLLLPLSVLSLVVLNYNCQRLNHTPNYYYDTTTAKWTMRLNPTSFPGTKYTITEFPRPALRRLPNVPIDKFDDSLHDLCDQMMTIMYEAQGVGLAAPQIGLNQDLFVYNPTGDRASSNMERIICNPVITEYSQEIEVEEEGCLSLRSDDCAGQVARSSFISVQYQNELGQQIRRRLKGFEARVFQHEYDHLRGILCWDRYAPEDRDSVRANIDKLLGLYTEPDAQIEADETSFKAMQPPPLSSALAANRMPPLEETEEGTPKKQKKTATTKSGFGGGGGSAGGFAGKKATSANKKKKKKKAK